MDRLEEGKQKQNGFKKFNKNLDKAR